MTTKGIRVGGLYGAKASSWSKVLEISEKSSSNEIRSTADDIREVTEWKCPVDKKRVYALCQIHDVYIDGKRWRTNDVARPLRAPKSWNSEEKGKGKTI